MDEVKKQPVAKTPKVKEITPQLISDALVEHYHNGATDAAVQRKFGISRPVWLEIKEKHGKIFLEKFGQRQKVAVADVDMDAYWKTVEIAPAPKIVSTRSKKEPSDSAPESAAAAETPQEVPPPSKPSAKGRPRKQ